MIPTVVARAWSWAGVIIAALLTLLPGIAAAQGRRVAVLDFANTAKDAGVEWLGPATAETITTKLLGVHGLNLVERLHLYRVLSEQKLALSDVVDPSQAIKIGKLVSADQVVLGSYIVFGRVVRFTARFVDTATGTILATSQVDGALDQSNPGALFSALDKLAQATIDSLNTRVAIVAGTPQAVPVEASRRIDPTPGERANIAKAPTNSLDAQKAYGEGLAAFKRSNWAEAARHHQRVMALDPDYAGGWQRLGLALGPLQRFDEAITAFQSEQQAARRRGDERGQVRAVLDMAEMRNRQGRTGDALAYAEQALRLAERFGNESLQALALNDLGVYQRQSGRKAEALASAEESVRLKETLGEDKELGATLNNIGWIHYEERRYAEAVRFYERALPIVQRQDNAYGESKILTNMAQAYEGLGRYADARRSLERAVRVWEQRGNELQQGLTLVDMARVQARNNDAGALSSYERALAFFDRAAAAAAPEERLKHGVLAEALEEIGDFHKQAGRHAEASALYQRSLRAFERYPTDTEARTRILNKLNDVAAQQRR